MTRLGTMEKKPDKLAPYMPDHAMAWRTKPGGEHRFIIGERDLSIHVGRDGRRMLNTPASGPKVAFYGCSFTFGFGLSDEEAFCHIVQEERKDLRIMNRGTSGHGSIHFLLQLLSDSFFLKPEKVIFCHYTGHRYRNVVYYSILNDNQELAKRDIGVRAFPKAVLGTNGLLYTKWVRFPRPEILGLDLSDFSPEEYHMDATLCEVYREAKKLSDSIGAEFAVAILQKDDRLDGNFLRFLEREGIPTIDCNIPLTEEYTFLPHNRHPNQKANRLYAERILNYLSKP